MIQRKLQKVTDNFYKSKKNIPNFDRNVFRKPWFIFVFKYKIITINYPFQELNM